MYYFMTFKVFIVGLSGIPQWRIRLSSQRTLPLEALPDVIRIMSIMCTLDALGDARTTILTTISTINHAKYM